MATKKPGSKITDLKIMRGQVYATIAVSKNDTSTTQVAVKLTASHKGLAEALEPLQALVLEAADAQLNDGIVAPAVSDARTAARQEVAGQVLSMVKRGTMPHELERALRPLAGPNYKP